MRHVRHSTFVFVLLLGTSDALQAQAGPPQPWNRELKAVSVLPRPGEEGTFDIRPVFSVSAEPTTAPLDLSTHAVILVNGQRVEILEFRISAGVALGGCSTACQEQLQSCVCLEGTSFCGCGSILVCDPPVPATLQPEDEIMVLLRPAPGALPDEDQEEDNHSIVFDGGPSFWDREIASVEARPTPGAAPGTYDVDVGVDLHARYDGALDFHTELVLLVNAEPVAEFPTVGDWLSINPCPAGCQSQCAFDSDGLPRGVCEIQSENLYCPCYVFGFASAKFVAVNAQPGDEIMVLLRPVPGALPELPGLDENDNGRIRVPGSTSPSFDLDFGRPCGNDVPVAAGVHFQQTVECTLTTADNPTSDGAQGWAVGVSADNARIIDVTTDGTTAGNLIQNGFQVNELTQGAGNEGALSAVVLSISEKVTLPPEGTETLARVEVEGLPVAAGECVTVRMYYRDGLQGSGEPVNNSVTFQNLSFAPTLGECRFRVCGRRANWSTYDCNGDGVVDIADAICHLSFLFLGGSPPGCNEAMDFNGDGLTDIADAIAQLSRLFLGGPPPASGFGCNSYPTCDVSPSCN